MEEGKQQHCRWCCWSCNRKTSNADSFSHWGFKKKKKLLCKYLYGGGGGGFLHAQMHQWRFLMTLQSHADFFYSALNGQLNSPLLPTLLPLNELRQSATIHLLRLLRHLKRVLSSVERRLFPRGSVWSPCGDNLKVWRLSFSPWQWRYPATAFVEVSGKSGAFEESCSSLSVAYNFDIWVSRVSGICYCIWKKKCWSSNYFSE